MQFVVKVIDEQTGQPIPVVDLVYVNQNGETIYSNGQPVYVQTDVNGSYTFIAGASSINIKASVFGYNSKLVNLQPGTTIIKLSQAVQGPEAVITAARSTDNRKKIFTVILIAAILFAIYKYSA